MAPTTASKEGFRDDANLLNTEDLKRALDLTVNLGRSPDKDGVSPLFEVPFRIKKMFWDDVVATSGNETFQSFLKSKEYKEASSIIVRTLDMDGDGKITPKDFQLMYDQKLKAAINQNETVLNQWLPFAGQCVFGIAVGWGFGRLARNTYKGKLWIAGLGFAAYSGLQYMIQQNFVNQSVLEEAFKRKVKELADVNGDGEINREDLNALVENRMRYISTKLGPGGLAPGAVGYGSLALGFARGIRMI